MRRLQLILAAPFLINFLTEYIIGAFNLGRVFLYEWTVNFQVSPEDVVSRWFHLSASRPYCLIILWEVLVAILFCQGLAPNGVPHCEQLLVLPLYVQFYWCNVCLQPALPVLCLVLSHHCILPVWTTGYPVMKLQALIIGVIEMCWNTTRYSGQQRVQCQPLHHLVGLLKKKLASHVTWLFLPWGQGWEG